MFLIVFTIFILIGLLSYYLIFSSLNLPAKLQEKNVDVNGISLVICAKNEIENLQKYLSLWLNQDGLAFEVIVVNDRSEDASLEFLKGLTPKFPNLKIINLNQDHNSQLKGKRSALLAGIKAAKFDYVALTDADCYPSSNAHLKVISEAFWQNTEVVLGYSPYESSGGILGALVRYETSLTALQYLSFAKIGIPYMGVGRNIAYKKSVLTENVFKESNLSSGGDDDLMVSLIANNRNTEILLDSASFVYSVAPKNWQEYFRQKQRHYSTAKHYSLFRLIAVGGFGALNVLFYIAMFTLLFMHVNQLLVLSLYLCKLLSFGLVNYSNLRKMRVIEILRHIVYLDFIFTFIFLFNHLKALKGKHGWS